MRFTVAAWPRLLCLLGLLAGVGRPQQARTLVPVPSAAVQPAIHGAYYALVIGINQYPKSLPTLKTAVNDAKAVADVLSRKYGFQTRLLLDKDATRDNILDAIDSYRETLGADDNLLIYYAGHGYSDHTADKAYWLPVDAGSSHSSKRIIADDITTDIRVQNARHVLVISDSCYSGGLSRDPGTEPSVNTAAFINRMMTNRSRTLMSSGGDEPVSDSGTDGHSVFAYALLRALEQSGAAEFAASDLLYKHVREQVAGRSAQMPQYAMIRNSGDDQGDFVFTQSSVQLPSQPVPAVRAQLPAQSNVLADPPRVVVAPAPTLTAAIASGAVRLFPEVPFDPNHDDKNKVSTHSLWLDLDDSYLSQIKRVTYTLRDPTFKPMTVKAGTSQHFEVRFTAYGCVDSATLTAELKTKELIVADFNECNALVKHPIGTPRQQ